MHTAHVHECTHAQTQVGGTLVGTGVLTLAGAGVAMARGKEKPRPAPISVVTGKQKKQSSVAISVVIASHWQLCRMVYDMLELKIRN